MDVNIDSTTLFHVDELYKAELVALQPFRLTRVVTTSLH